MAAESSASYWPPTTSDAWTESFMGTLKAEMLQSGTFIHAHDARTEIFTCIEAYCNTRRKHSSPACQSPFQFE